MTGTEDPVSLRNIILRGVVGSTAHGLNVQDSIEDRDEMAVRVEDMHELVGVRKPFESYVYRSAEEREGQGARSRAGDLDLVVYGLHHYVQLALKGNPSILLLLYLKNYMVKTHDGDMLRELAPKLVSKHALRAFLGYLTAQRMRMLGLRGGKDIHRPELVEKYGYDTKYAMHMLRLGYQGVEMATCGYLQLPMSESLQEYLRDVRLGRFTMEECLKEEAHLEGMLMEQLVSSKLPEEPDRDLVESWLMEVYYKWWFV